MMRFCIPDAEDLSVIAGMYRDAVGSAGCVWSEDYPTLEDAANDFQRGDLFCLKDDSGIPVAAISVDDDMTTDSFSCWTQHLRPWAEFCRVVVRSDLRGRGLAPFMVRQLNEELIRRGLRGVHYCVAKENVPAQRAYEKTGFRLRGEAFVYGGQYLLFEKPLPQIRKAESRDIPHVARIYRELTEGEESARRVTGWIAGVYPTESTARAALEADELYVLEEDGEVLSAMRINRVQDPAYAQASWHFPAPDGQVLVMHTLVVSPRGKGRGYGARMEAYFEQCAREQNASVLRIDTNARNAFARGFYRRLGFREAGVVPCSFNGIPDVHLVCLEKAL